MPDGSFAESATGRLTATLPLWQQWRAMEERQPLQVLIAYRTRQGMTSADLAQFLEESRPTVHRWETGARKIDEQKLSKIAEKTGIPPRELRPDLAALIEGEQ